MRFTVPISMLALATFAIAVALTSCAKAPDVADTTLLLDPSPAFAPIAFSEDEACLRARRAEDRDHFHTGSR